MARLNDTFVKTVTLPASGDVCHYDDDQPGFALRVYSSGTTKWAYIAKVHGRVIKRSIGDTRLYTAQKARGIAREIAGELRQGHDRYAEEKKKVAELKAAALEKLKQDLEPRLDDAGLTYIEKKKLKKSSQDFYNELLKRELKPYANYRLREFTPELIEEIYAEVSERNSPIQASKAVNFIKSIFYFNKRPNPIPRGMKMTKPKARRARLEPRDGVRVWKAIESLADEQHRAFLGLLLLTGVRGGELEKLTLKDVDLVGGSMTMKDTKNGEDHRVYLSAQAEDLLRSVVRGGHPDNKVFRNKFEPRWALRNADLPEFSNHDFRKVFSITAMDCGVPYPVIKAAMNHKTNDVTLEHYLQATPSQLRDCWAKVANYYTGGSDDHQKATN